MIRFRLANKIADSKLPERVKSAVIRTFWPIPYNDLEREEEVIFIHIPKCAGTAVGKALGFPRDGHDRAIWYKLYDKYTFEKSFKFTIVRNPWDRIVSAYFHLKQGGGHKTTQKWVDENLSEYSTFRSFVLSLKKDRVRKRITSWTHFVPQYKWITDSNENIIVDFVGRVENIKDDFSKISKKIGREGVLEKRNTSEHDRFKKYYDEEMKRVVKKVYEKDIEYLGYEY